MAARQAAERPSTRQRVRCRARYEGRVQGVGFRHTVCELARPLAVGGTVRNEPDGSVTLVAEGSPGEVARLLAAVRERFAANLTRETVTDAPEATEKSPGGADELTIIR